jgi:RNA polymerase II subunit A-like phosphatase
MLHMQEKLDRKKTKRMLLLRSAKNGDTTHEQPHHKHNLLKDDDVELTYLEKHLTQLHKAFYDEYDRALVSAHGGTCCTAEAWSQQEGVHQGRVSRSENCS